MTLTQRSDHSDLQKYLGLAAAQLADADATALLLQALYRMQIFMDDTEAEFTETDGKKEIQKQAEVRYGAYLYYMNFGDKKKNLDNYSDGAYPGSINLGGVSLNTTETNVGRRARNHYDSAKENLKMFNDFMFQLVQECNLACYSSLL